MSLLDSLAATVPGPPDAAADGAVRGAVAGGLADTLRRITVSVRDGGSGGGAGVIWSADGLIVTNAHVVRGRGARVELPDGRDGWATLLARDPARDLAVLALEAAGLTGATLGDPRRLRPGELVAAMGHPFGVRDALSLGIVHTVRADDADRSLRWIRTDLRLAPGNSGGPLVNAAGALVGINALIHRGLGHAVSVTTVERFLEDVRAASLRAERARGAVRLVIIRRGAPRAA